MWWEWEGGGGEAAREETPVDFDFISLLSKSKKWHPDKKQGEENATSRFQEINEAYQVLSNPAKRQEYDNKGILYVQDQNVVDYLNRHKGLILTCNGLGIRYSVW
ncbi:uncharacterized protein LOC133919848 isoform X2 [Phragmites australis]|uniref:uncharacterized protein LOC133919848 isoform X2 n=1 Tax=Phragmites australis TaxID=29695 RepID=UPI002D790D5D|nr:uncharacterized protein LOC133919848 isoform X2 [Phragmites australis]